MLAVNPWIWVESCPGAICHWLGGVPGFWFSRTIGFAFAGAAAVLGAAVVVAPVVVGADVTPVFVTAASGTGTLL